MENFIALDIETTGLDPANDQIIEVGAVKFCNGEIIETFSSLVKPSKSIEPFIEQLTGITNAMLDCAPDSKQVIEGLANFLGKELLVLHNAAFDLTFLEKLFKEPLKNNYIDTLELTRICFPRLNTYRLNDLSQIFNLPLASHRALDDAISCGYLLLKNLEFIGTLKPHILSILADILKQPANFISKFLQKKLFEKAWASKIESPDFLFSSIVPELKYTVKSPPPKTSLISDFTLEEIEALLAKQSLWLSKYPNFEFRPSQIEMLKKISSSFLEKRFLIAEAATGTGKSLAYLLPAILWATLKEEKVVIATHTINLQEQLFVKDLPLLQQVLGLKNVTSTVIKGRNNYLCLAKLKMHYKNALHNPSELNYFLAKIIIWLESTETGDKSELNLKQNDHGHWSNLSADSHSCLGKKCEFYLNCYLMHARKKAEHADILITNHSLLLSDIKVESGVLPTYKFLIIDEAHNLEQESINHLTIGCSSYLLYSLIKNLVQILELLSNFISKIKKQKLLPAENNCLIDLNKIKLEIQKTISNFQESVNDFKIAINSLKLKLDEIDQNQVKWLKAAIADLSEWKIVKSAAQNVIFHLHSLTKDFSELLLQIEYIDELSFSLNINIYIQKCQEYANNLTMLLNIEEEDKVVWLESNEEDFFSLKQAPLQVGELLYEKLYKDKHGIIFTSATLSIEKDFTFFKKQVGLELFPKERLVTAIYQSPFNYEKQALLCIPTDLPEPTENNNRYEYALHASLEKMIIANKGRTLVLFTSYQQLFNTYYTLKEPLHKQNINLLAHRIDGSRTNIMEQFKKNNRSVLFGTNSFWEGVDIPGNALTLLIIIKLPFQAPGIPTLAARMEYLRKKNQDPFRNLNLPQAIIRFKQGFGRLVRSQQDKGIVIVMDKRIIQKSYGKSFLNSLPVNTHFRGSCDDIIQVILNGNLEQIS